MTHLLIPPAAPANGADPYAPIRADLAEVEAILARTLKSRYPRIAALVDHVKHYRGKRLRPALLLLVARACGRVAPAHHVLGAVVEMVHTATLVHDDVLDGATVRRHVATVNAGWGVPASILLGDYLFTHAFHLAATTGSAEACRLIGEATNRTCEGELCQGLERGNLALTEDEYLGLIDGKTADLIACCCRLGALFSGAPAETVERLARYGRGLGMAFQIADDLLDYTGDPLLTGKPRGSDLRDGRATLPFLLGLSRATARERQCLLAAFGNAALDNAGMQEICDLLARYDAFDQTREAARDHVDQAAASLALLPPTIARDCFSALTDFVVQRDR